MLISVQFATGCKTSSEVESTNPGFIEREQWAWTRVIASPLNLFGPTVATYEHIYTSPDWKPFSSVLITPLVPALTLVAGALRTGADISVGVVEICTSIHFGSVAFPWESYDYQIAKYWNYGAAVTIAIGASTACFAPHLAPLVIAFIPFPDSGQAPVSNPAVAQFVAQQANQAALAAASTPAYSSSTVNSTVNSPSTVRANSKQTTKISPVKTSLSKDIYVSCPQCGRQKKLGKVWLSHYKRRRLEY